jgi:hypothetical protein
MVKITPLMTSLHVGHKAEERLECIDNMLFNKCEDTKFNILKAFWWYRKNSIPLDKVKQAREKINEMSKYTSVTGDTHYRQLNHDDVLAILDKLMESEETE